MEEAPPPSVNLCETSQARSQSSRGWSTMLLGTWVIHECLDLRLSLLILTECLDMLAEFIVSGFPNVPWHCPLKFSAFILILDKNVPFLSRRHRLMALPNMIL